MKRPKSPENENYWLNIIKDPEKVKAFNERGSERAKKNLARALKLQKWLDIQKKREE